MKRILAGVLAVWSSVAWAGFSLTVENDLFFHTDDDYSHGTELAWIDDARPTGGNLLRTSYGLNQLMYTPMDITIATNQPNDREWCGTMSVFMETWKKAERNEKVRQRWEIGVLGPDAHCEESQKIVHKWVGSAEPMGWDNQMPDEPMLNYYMERHHFLNGIGEQEGWQVTCEAVYGGTLGTTFINAEGGVLAKAGWNIPDFMSGGIVPKGGRPSRWFVYAFGELDCIYVLHNATLGKSFFRDRDPGQEQTLEPLVGEGTYGVSAGYRKMALVYTSNHRTAEYDGQPKATDWGMIKLEFANQF
jgi:lipid A 3-O-deacylase